MRRNKGDRPDMPEISNEPPIPDEVLDAIDHMYDVDRKATTTLLNFMKELQNENRKLKKQDIVDATKSEFPEHDKLKNIHKQSNWLGDFIVWMGQKGLYVSEYDSRNDELRRCNLSIEVLLAKYFDIDLKKLEQEKRQMLKQIRDDNSNRRSTK